MKKMTFALACASTAVLFADSTIATPVATFEGEGLVGKTVAQIASAETDGPFWAYAESDTSSVKDYNGTGNLGKPPVQGDFGDNYLDLSTEGNTLWRSINAVQTAGQPGAAQSVPADTGIYIDTMVQFTPTEDGGEPELDSADKIAIWLNVTAGDAQTPSTTNLMVKTGSYDAQGTFASTCSVLSGVTVEAGSWYRLTIRAIEDICIAGNPFASYYKMPAFVIKLDGVELTSANPAFNTSFATELQQAAVLSSSTLADITAGKLFPSLVAGTPGATTSIQGLGFKGSGAIDNVQFTDYDPNPPAPASVDFMVKVPTGATGVKYAIGDAEAQDLPDGGKISGAAGATVTITGALADGTSFTKTGTISENGELDLSTPDWSFYLAADAEAANTYVIDSVTELVDFQKGVAAKLTTAGVTFKLGADIALTDTWTGIGLYGKDNVKTDAFADGAFQGVFDGNGNTISGLTLKSDYSGGTSTNKYIGFFFSTKDATIRNVKFGIANYGWDKGKSIADGSGGGIVVGTALSTTFDSVEIVAGETADTQTFYGTHAISAFAGFTSGTCSMTDCVNNLNLEENRSKDAKVAAFSACNQSNTPELTLTRCVNKGKITSTVGSYAAGFVCYNDGTVTLVNCENQGELGAKVYEFVANHDDGKGNYGSTINSGSKGTGAALAVNDTHVTGFAFRNAADGKYTDTVEAGKSYKVTAKNASAITLANVGDTITLDTTLAEATVTTTAADAYVAQAGNVYTVTAKADAEFTVSIDPTEAEWTAELTLPTPTITGTTATGSWSPAAITEPDAGTTNVYTYTVTVAATETTKATTKSVEFKVYKNAAVVYPDYITDDTAKGKFDTWASEVAKIDGDDRKTASMDAYLLNCAPASVDTAKAAFKIVSIEQDAKGAWTVKVTADEKTDGQAYGNGTIEVQGATTLKGPWAKDTAGAKFFKAILK